jgi:hypothetical protein
MEKTEKRSRLELDTDVLRGKMLDLRNLDVNLIQCKSKNTRYFPGIFTVSLYY